MTRIIVGYCRVSTSMQAASGLSLEDQESTIRAFAKDHSEYELEDVYVEPGVSAAHLQRPRLTSLRERIRTGGVDTLVVTHLDRLTRSVSDLRTLLDELQQYGTRLITLDDRWGDRVGLDSGSREDQDLMDMIAMFARWQRERIGGATKRAHALLLKKGKVTNHLIYGFDADEEKNLVPNERELAVILWVQELHAQGLSLRKIAEKLDEANIPTKQGRGKWPHTTVESILERQEDPDWRRLFDPHLEMLRD